MKFIDAIRAMGPGQLLITEYGHQYEIVDGFLRNLSDGKNYDCINRLTSERWQVIDKPRPRVRFAEAMRAALEGKVIKNVEYSHCYRLKDDGFYYVAGGHAATIPIVFQAGDWEIIEPEGDK